MKYRHAPFFRRIFKLSERENVEVSLKTWSDRVPATTRRAHGTHKRNVHKFTE